MRRLPLIAIGIALSGCSLLAMKPARCVATSHSLTAEEAESIGRPALEAKYGREMMARIGRARPVRRGHVWNVFGYWLDDTIGGGPSALVDARTGCILALYESQ
jgi:hypothetical protein